MEEGYCFSDIPMRVSLGVNRYPDGTLTSASPALDYAALKLFLFRASTSWLFHLSLPIFKHGF